MPQAITHERRVPARNDDAICEMAAGLLSSRCSLDNEDSVRAALSGLGYEVAKVELLIAAAAMVAKTRRTSAMKP